MLRIIRRNFYLFTCLILSLTVTLVIMFWNKVNYDYVGLSSESQRKHKLVHFWKHAPAEPIVSINIEEILERARAKIKADLINYNFSQSNVEKLEDLLMEHGGTPVRSLIVSAWRSGSTFFAELLNAMPSNFYHYEPLLKYKIQQIRGPPLAAEATNNLKKMFHCNYTGMEDYFEYAKQQLYYLNQFKHNRRLWDLCIHYLELCFDADFMAKFCKLFPFQSMKVVRFRLQPVDAILDDRSLNVKVVLLVRDPRGLLQSRRYRNFCKPSPDCIDPKLVCSDMIGDYYAAKRFIKKYPRRVMVLRYEDLALNLERTTRQVQKFLKLGPTQAMDEFLQTHTKFEVYDKDSTYRTTKNVPFKWKKLLDFEYVNGIQDVCEEAMGLWGYQLAGNASHMASENFMPLLPYTGFKEL